MDKKMRKANKKLADALEWIGILSELKKKEYWSNKIETVKKYYILNDK
jgi:hypothetical protein